MSGEVVDKLKGLGLTEYESKVYYALTRNSGLTAEEVSRLSGVPLTRVYSVLAGLQSKGIIVEVAGRPKRFDALQPKTAFRNYVSYVRQLMEEEYRRLESKARELSLTLEPMYWSNRIRLDSKGLLKELSSFGEMETYTKKLISSAKSEVKILTALFTWLDVVEEELTEAVTRGVRVRVVMNLSDEASLKRALKLKSLGVEVKLCSKGFYPVRGTISDDEAAVFAIYLAKLDKPAVMLPHYTENRGLVKVLADAFNHLWETGRPLEE